MKEIKAYRGLDQECLIKGLLAKYFYIMFMFTMGLFVTLIMSVVSLLKGTSSIGEFLIIILISSSLYAFSYIFFYRRSNRPKMTQRNTPVSFSNRSLFSLLYKK